MALIPEIKRYTLINGLEVLDESYGALWNNSLFSPTKNAVYDKIEAVIATIPGSGAYSGFTPGSVLFAGAGGGISQDNSNLFFNNTSNFLGINTNTPLSELHVVSTSIGGMRGIVSSQYTNDVLGSRLNLTKSRSTVPGVFTTIVTGDTLGRVRFWGDDGSQFLEMGGISVVSTATVASTRIPTYMVFSTATDTAPSVLTEAMRIDQRQFVGIGGNPVSYLTIPVTAPTSSNMGTVSIGAGAFNGITAGFFTGSSNGTQLAINAAGASTADLVNFQLAGADRFRINSTGQTGIRVNPQATWGFLQVLTNGSGGTQYANITLADNITNNTAKGGMIMGAPYTISNKVWTGFGTYTTATEKGVYLGGGGWATPDANALYFYTATTFNETNNAGILRFKVDPTGNFGIGTLAGTIDRLFHVEAATALTNTTSFNNRFSHITSGTATTSFGIGTEYELENGSGTNRIAASEEIIWTDATNATEDADWVLKLIKAGTLTEALRVTSIGGVITTAPVRLKGYTVATLPAGTQGDTAFCTDLLTPTFFTLAVGGGAIVGPVFYTGTQWVTY